MRERSTWLSCSGICKSLVKCLKYNQTSPKMAWGTSLENLFMLHAKNKDTGQPVHLCHLISNEAPLHMWAMSSLLHPENAPMWLKDYCKYIPWYLILEVFKSTARMAVWLWSISDYDPFPIMIHLTMRYSSHHSLHFCHDNLFMS